MVASLTRTSKSWAWVLIPRNMVMAMAPINSSVRAALCDLGRRKACTPLAMASVPVSALAPEAKARSSRNSETPPANGSSAPEEIAFGQASPRQRVNPTPRVSSTIR